MTLARCVASRPVAPPSFRTRPPEIAIRYQNIRSEIRLLSNDSRANSERLHRSCRDCKLQKVSLQRTFVQARPPTDNADGLLVATNAPQPAIAVVRSALKDRRSTIKENASKVDMRPRTMAVIDPRRSRIPRYMYCARTLVHSILLARTISFTLLFT